MASRFRSVCPHDCPSTCALEVELIDRNTVGKVYGAKDHAYTQGVICAKVSRYSERIHHPERLMTPLKRVVKKTFPNTQGMEAFTPISWEEALDTIAEKFKHIEASFGSEAIWPYHYAGTMGLVQRDGLDRFRHTFQTSRQHSTFCVTLADAGFRAGIGAKRGSDSRLIANSDLVVVWGGNPVSTQVNVMHLVAKARRNRGAKFVVIDPYRTKTSDKADMHLMLKPGTDGALACAVMHVLFESGYADQAYMDNYTARAEDFRQHLKTRTPRWAASITGLSEDDIIAFAELYGQTKKSFIRLGYGFSRSRNGAVNMHAASCLPAVTGAWQYEGGGALYGNSDIYTIDRTLIQGLDTPCNTRIIDQSRIGAALCGDESELQGGPPIKALFVQNTNPAVVAPDSRRVIEGLCREDLFTVVHEQFLTETAELADIVLPATMFLEHDDIYTASGHTHLQIGPKLIEPPGECRSNHRVLSELAERLNLDHIGYQLSEKELIEKALQGAKLPDFNAMIDNHGLDCAPSHLQEDNYLNGFNTPDKRFHFAPDWSSVGKHYQDMPEFPDHWPVIDNSSDECPLRLVAAPARQFLNTSFTETLTSKKMEKKPHAKLHPDDLINFDLQDGQAITLGNSLGEVSMHVQSFDGVQPGTVVVESLWPNRDFIDGIGINTLVSSEPGKPNGGAVFHDTAVWIKAYSA